jgi:oligosaccharide repeat unit polymerase
MTVLGDRPPVGVALPPQAGLPSRAARTRNTPRARRATRAARRRASLPPTHPRGLWWVAPIGTILMVVPLSLYVSIANTQVDFRLFFRSPKLMTGHYALLFLMAAVFLAIGTALPQALRPSRWRPAWPGFDEAQLRIMDKAMNVTFWLTAFGYAAFLAAGVARGARPSTLANALTNNFTGQVKTMFAPVTGITTFTQMGIAFTILAGLRLAIRGRNGRVLRRLGVVFLLALVRSFFLTERLAILELAVPLLAISAVRMRHRSRYRSLVPFMPILFIPVLLVVFGLFEYSRSWVFFRTRTSLSYPDFVVHRLAGYYATAYNNGAISLISGKPKGVMPFGSLQALWTTPGLSQLHLFQLLSHGFNPGTYGDALYQLGNPEFNNPCGLAQPLFDFGIPGGMVFFVVAGIVVGFTYRGFRNNNPYGVLIYPLLFTGLMELPRYLYWTQGRVVPSVVALAITARLMTRASHPRRVFGAWLRSATPTPARALAGGVPAATLAAVAADPTAVGAFAAAGRAGREGTGPPGPPGAGAGGPPDPGDDPGGSGSPADPGTAGPPGGALPAAP